MNETALDINAIIESCPPQPGRPWPSRWRLAKRLREVGTDSATRAAIVGRWVRRYAVEQTGEHGETLLPPDTNADVVEAEVAKCIELMADGKTDRVSAAEAIAQAEEAAYSAGERGTDPAAEQLHDGRTRLLARVCRLLVSGVASGEFFLSTRDAAGIVGSVHAMDGSRVLDALLHKGIIERIEVGSSRTRKASTFKYVGDLAVTHSTHKQ